MTRLEQFRLDLNNFMGADNFGPVEVRFINLCDLVESPECSELELELSTEGQREVPVVITASPDDYPAGTAVTIAGGQPEILTAPLLEAFQFACDVLTGVRVPAASQTSPVPLEVLDDGPLEVVYSSIPSPPMDTTRTEEASSSDLDDWDADDDVASLGSDGPHGIQGQWEEAKAAMDTHVYLTAQAGLDHCDFGFLIPINGLSAGTRQAWSLLDDSPLHIRFRDVPCVYFRASGRQPTVRVTLQEDEDRVFAVGKQLEKIAGKWLSENWHAQAGEERMGGNVIIRIYKYLCERLPQLNDFCIICDGKHAFSMPLPSVCNGALCSFAYETLGLMSDVATLATQLEILDLLLVFFRAAVASPRVELLLDPWPAVPDPTAPNTLAINPEAKDRAVIAAILEKMPCPSHLRSRGWTDALKAAHNVAFPLVRWVMSTNRTFLCALEQERRLNFMRTPHQFLMISDSPAKEDAFLKAKAQFGRTVFAFHGSNIDNWHSILRSKLINFKLSTSTLVHF